MPRLTYEVDTEEDMSLAVRRFAAWLQTKQSPKIDIKELAGLCLDAGWNREQAIIAVAISAGESGHRIKALNVDKRHGQEDYGLFQINETWKPTEEQKWVPRENVKLAFQLWDKARRWHEHLKKLKREGKPLPPGSPDPDTMDPFNRWMAYRDRGINLKRFAWWNQFIEQATKAVDAELARRQQTQ
jgi:hypothetical protein